MFLPLLLTAIAAGFLVTGIVIIGLSALAEEHIVVALGKKLFVGEAAITLPKKDADAFVDALRKAGHGNVADKLTVVLTRSPAWYELVLQLDSDGKPKDMMVIGAGKSDLPNPDAVRRYDKISDGEMRVKTYS